MKAVARFEVHSEASVISDEQWLEFEHANGRYRARVRNIVRSDYSSPFTLTVEISFETDSIKTANDDAEDLLAEFLNLMVLVTEARFKRKCRVAIVDAEADKTVRDCLLSAGAPEHDDPIPLLVGDVARTFSQVSQKSLSAEAQRSLRWVRIGLDSRVNDDQYQCFWFALELLANSKNATEKVHDVCPRCRSPLFCASCNAHPMHRPFVKQKIRALMREAAPELKDERIDLLEAARNALAHGSTLREFEAAHPPQDDEPHLVDTLYEVVRAALLLEFPADLRDALNIDRRDSVVSMRSTLVVHLQTVVPTDEGGELDLSFKGIHVGVEPQHPPQSQVPGGIFMTKEQLNQLRILGHGQGEDAEFVRQLCSRVVDVPDGRRAMVLLSADLKRVTKAMRDVEKGPWQDLIRSIFATTRQG